MDGLEEKISKGILWKRRAAACLHSGLTLSRRPAAAEKIWSPRLLLPASISTCSCSVEMRATLPAFSYWKGGREQAGREGWRCGGEAALAHEEREGRMPQREKCRSEGVCRKYNETVYIRNMKSEIRSFSTERKGRKSAKKEKENLKETQRYEIDRRTESKLWLKRQWRQCLLGSMAEGQKEERKKMPKKK